MSYTSYGGGKTLKQFNKMQKILDFAQFFNRFST